MSNLSLIVPAPTTNYFVNGYMDYRAFEDANWIGGLGQIFVGSQNNTTNQVLLYQSLFDNEEYYNKAFFRSVARNTWLDIRNYYHPNPVLTELKTNSINVFSFWIKVFQPDEGELAEKAGMVLFAGGSVSNMNYVIKAFNLVNNEAVTFSHDVLDYKLPDLTKKRWQHCYVVFRNKQGAGNYALGCQITGTSASGNIGYVLDGVMLEKLDEDPSWPKTLGLETSYQTTGLYRPSTFAGKYEQDCYTYLEDVYSGHISSPAFRRPVSEYGGVIADMEDLGIHTVSFQGTGAPKIKVNLTDNAFSRTKTYQSTQIENRVTAVSGQLVSSDLATLHKVREQLLQLLLNKSIQGEQLSMLYTGAYEPKVLKGYYESGLELDKVDGFVENLLLRFTSTTPYTEGLGNRLALLSGKEIITAGKIKYTKADGTDNELEYTSNGTVNCIAKYLNFLIIAGSFTTFNGVSANRMVMVDTTREERFSTFIINFAGFTPAHNILSLAVDESLQRIYVGLDSATASFHWYDVNTDTFHSPTDTEDEIEGGQVIGKVTKIKVHKYTYQNELQTVVGLYGPTITGYKTVPIGGDITFSGSERIVFWLPAENEKTFKIEYGTIAGTDYTIAHNRFLGGPKTSNFNQVWGYPQYEGSQLYSYAHDIADFMFVDEPFDAHAVAQMYQPFGSSYNLFINGFTYFIVGRFEIEQPVTNDCPLTTRAVIAHMYNRIPSAPPISFTFPHSLFYPKFSEGGLFEHYPVAEITYGSEGEKFNVESNIRNIFYGPNRDIYVTGRVVGENIGYGRTATNIMKLENGYFVDVAESWWRTMWQGATDTANGPDALSYPTKFDENGKMIGFLPVNHKLFDGYDMLLHYPYGEPPKNQEKYEVAFGQVEDVNRSNTSTVYMYNGYFEWANAYIPTLRHPEEIVINDKIFRLYKINTDVPSQTIIHYTGNAPSLCRIFIKNKHATKKLAAYAIKNVTSNDVLVINKYIQPDERIIIETDDTQGTISSNLRDIDLNIASTGALSLVRNPSNIKIGTDNIIESCFYVYGETEDAYEVYMIFKPRYLGVD